MLTNRLLILCTAVCVSDVAMAQGESIRALSARPGVDKGMQKADLNTHFNYLVQPQVIPLRDDFSIDRTRKRWAQVGDPDVTLSETMYRLEVNGVSTPDMVYATDTTFIYTIDLQDPPVTTRQALDMVTVTLRDLSTYPPTSNDVDAWPAYNVYDTLQNPPNDTIWMSSPALIQDSLLVYDVAAAGGTYTTDGVPGPLILWEDDDVYVNGTYPVDPPTIGVATFDGLARTGHPYNFEQYTAYGIADHLTSVPIDLAYPPGDSIYLSFFYQTQGLSGDAFVQPQDSLVLEFYAPLEDAWVRVWRTPYTATQPFKQVMVPILQDRFLKNGFRMRFLNYATLSGSFDHWHLDYVRLGAQRTYDDTTLVDVAYTYPESSLLNTYTSVPFNKFEQAPASVMAAEVELTQRNLDENDRFITYGMEVARTDGSGLEGFTNGTNTSGNASSSFIGTHPVNSAPNNFVYDPGTATTSAFWEVKFWTNATPDINRYNDTTRFVQEVSNYYAFDDGSAEMGYGLNAAGGKLAYRFDLLGGDSLRAVRMYFNPIANQPPLSAPTDGSFLITIWRSLDPEVIQHQNFSFSSPQYRQDGLNHFVEYALDSAIYVEGTIYVGWTQTNDANMNLGFDRNRDTRSRIFYRTGGSWINTAFNGSLMMRPVFVAAEDPFVGIEAPTATDALLLYPNPANDSFRMRLTTGAGAVVQCLDATGRVVLQERSSADQVIHTGSLSEGIYLVRVTDERGGVIGQSRLSIHH